MLFNVNTDKPSKESATYMKLIFKLNLLTSQERMTQNNVDNFPWKVLL